MSTTPRQTRFARLAAREANQSDLWGLCPVACRRLPLGPPRGPGRAMRGLSGSALVDSFRERPNKARKRATTRRHRPTQLGARTVKPARKARRLHLEDSCAPVTDGRFFSVLKMSSWGVLRAAPTSLAAFGVERLARRMDHLEDAKPVEKIRTSIGERIQAGAQDHVLANTVSNGLLHDVLRQLGSNAHPAAEAEQNRGRHLGAEPFDERGSSVPGEWERESVIEDSGRRLVQVQRPGRPPSSPPCGLGRGAPRSRQPRLSCQAPPPDRQQ